VLSLFQSPALLIPPLAAADVAMVAIKAGLKNERVNQADLPCKVRSLSTLSDWAPEQCALGRQSEHSRCEQDLPGSNAIFI
jgi:hypothetical protein